MIQIAYTVEAAQPVGEVGFEYELEDQAAFKATLDVACELTNQRVSCLLDAANKLMLWDGFLPMPTADLSKPALELIELDAWPLIAAKSNASTDEEYDTLVAKRTAIILARAYEGGIWDEHKRPTERS